MDRVLDASAGETARELASAPSSRRASRQAEARGGTHLCFGEVRMHRAAPTSESPAHPSPPYAHPSSHLGRSAVHSATFFSQSRVRARRPHPLAPLRCPHLLCPPTPQNHSGGARPAGCAAAQRERRGAHALRAAADRPCRVRAPARRLRHRALARGGAGWRSAPISRGARHDLPPAPPGTHRARAVSGAGSCCSSSPSLATSRGGSCTGWRRRCRWRSSSPARQSSSRARVRR